MSISGIFGKSNLSRITFALEAPQEIYAGSPFPLTVTLKNPRRLLPAFLIRLRTDSFEAFFPFVNNGEKASAYPTLKIEKRGLHRIENTFLFSVFPFNFFTRFRKLSLFLDLIVFPSLTPCDLSAVYDENRKLQGEKYSEKIGYEADIVSIREYVRGDPLKHIHWKATAKTGKLKTKEHASLSYEPVIIDFDKILIKDIEERIRCVAYTIVRLCKKGVPVGMKIKDTFYAPDISQHHKITLLRKLALYGSDKAGTEGGTGKP